MKTIWLVYNRYLEVDRKDYFRKYDNGMSSMKLLKGAPLLFHLEGHLFYLSDLVKMAKPKDRKIVNDYITECNAKNEVRPADGAFFIRFRFNRSKNYDLC